MGRLAELSYEAAKENMFSHIIESIKCRQGNLLFLIDAILKIVPSEVAETM